MTTRLNLKDRLLDAQLVRIAGTADAGGALLGECLATASRVKGTDLGSWYSEWTPTADAAYALGEAALAHGDRVGARAAFFRACGYYRTGGGMLMGLPVDPRLVTAYRRQTEAFQRGVALLDRPPERLQIPYEGTTLPGYLFRATGSAEPRATVILNDGYDGTVEELYFLVGAAALEHGYNVLAFDGPGQGLPLTEQGLTMRHDWEHVVTPVVDVALSRPDVDPARLALVGVSLGGYLAPRAASREHRLAACIADGGSFDVYDSYLARIPTPIAAGLRNDEKTAQTIARRLLRAVAKRPTAGWSLRRAQQVHGIEDPIALLTELRSFTLKDVAKDITCPTLVINAEGDPVGASAPQLVEALTCEKEFIHFTAAEGAGDHCETAARPLCNARSFAWLDTILN